MKKYVIRHKETGKYSYSYGNKITTNTLLFAMKYDSWDEAEASIHDPGLEVIEFDDEKRE